MSPVLYLPGREAPVEELPKNVAHIDCWLSRHERAEIIRRLQEVPPGSVRIRRVGLFCKWNIHTDNLTQDQVSKVVREAVTAVSPHRHPRNLSARAV